MKTVYSFLVCLSMLLIGVNLHANEEGFTPPQPVLKDDWDWVKLTSGEWLKGEIKAMYNEVIEFDSDELDLLELDWEDIAEVRTGQSYTAGFYNANTSAAGLNKLKFTGNHEQEGRLLITQEHVTVINTATGQQETFNRADLLTITPAAASELGNWTAKISLGLDIRDGNTEQFEYSAKADVKRRTANSRFTINYLGKYTNTQDVNTVNNHRINLGWDVFVARKLYVTPVFYEYFRDPFLNIAYQNTLGAGAGYQIIDTSKVEWDISGGIAYKRTNFDSVEVGEDDEVDSPSLVLQTDYEWEINGDTDFFIRYGMNWLDEKSGQYTHHALTGFEFELTSILDFDVTFVWDRVEKPTRNADGTLPKQNDYQMIFGLGIDI